jgi:hypothetical protein
MHPLVLPNHGGSTLFVYHAIAVMEMREHAVRVGRFTDAARRPKLTDLWTQIAGLQLGATLKHLSPANDIGLFPVTINTTSANANGAGRRMRM